MKATDPQFLYMVLVLPTLFGLTLFAEGLNKVLKEERAGWISLVAGLIFIWLVILAFLYFSQIWR